MKRYFCLGILIIMSMAATAAAQRKLPAKAYLSSAKIDVIEGRPQEAVALLDSLFMYYGCVPEGLDLMAQIMIDFATNASAPQEKEPHVIKMVAYFDSLRMCCSDENIDKKLRKECASQVKRADSTQVRFWREFYNGGLEQLASLQESSNELASATDSETIKFYKNDIDVKADTAIASMSLAIMIDSNDSRPYVAVGSILEGQKKYEEAIDWFVKSLKYTKDSSSMLLSIAYNYVNIDKYCEGIPYFEHFYRLNPTDLSNANNLTICYIRCEMDEKAMATYRQMLTVDSTHPEALLGLGNFYRRDAGELLKAARLLADEKKDAEAKTTRDKGNIIFDTAAQYYERYIRAYPDSISGYDEYGLINFILGRYDKAAGAFKKLAELNPANVDNWISLGDSYFSLNDFKGAIPAYEKAVELTPGNKVLWERLSFLYLETGNSGKKAEADKKLQGLN